MPGNAPASKKVHLVSVVVPVYRGELTLAPLVAEIADLVPEIVTPDGHSFRVIEVVLVYDNGPDNSADTIRMLSARHTFVKPVWLARNSGQHAATAAGVASSGGHWVVTMDEDGQHHPSDIAAMLDTAMRDRVYLVYGRQRSGAPHAWWRNASSSAAKRMAGWMVGSDISQFSSYRLLEGTRARAITAYIGPRTYFDSALSWAIGKSSVCEITKRQEWRSESGYSVSNLLSHFWTLVLSSGTRPLRAVSLVGCVAALVGFVTSAVIVVRKVSSGYNAPGWASTIVVELVLGGLILFTVGVVAEYIGALLRSAQGKPLYIVLEDPANDFLQDSSE
jgi:polyisoprenyl-phosphate glycosyltransferase